MMSEGQYSVIDVPERDRFEIRDGQDVAGFTEYRRRGSLIAFLHTEVAPEYEGQGLASGLISTALDRSREQSLSVLPFCPFVRGYIEKHPSEYLDLVPAELREQFELPSVIETSSG
jgi:uncharacterized protein